MDGADREFLLKYVAVIDSKEDVKGAMEDIYVSKAAMPPMDLEGTTPSEKTLLIKELTEKSLTLYRKEVDGKHLFYDEVEVLYEYEFRLESI